MNTTIDRVANAAGPLLVALMTTMLLSCLGAEKPRSRPDCEGDHFYAEWTIDGTTHYGICGQIASRVYHNDPASEARLYGYPIFEAKFTGQQFLAAAPVCRLSMHFMNIEFVAGSTGPISPDQWAVGDMGLDPNVWLKVGTDVSLSDCQIGDDSGGIGVSTGGTWEVVQGGLEGERIEVVVRDVTFEPAFGHTYSLDFARWRGPLDTNNLDPGDPLLIYP